MSRLEARLAELAAAGQTITYGALAHEMGWRVQDLTAALEQLMEIDAAEGRPLRAALCEGAASGWHARPGIFRQGRRTGL